MYDRISSFTVKWFQRDTEGWNSGNNKSFPLLETASVCHPAIGYPGSSARRPLQRPFPNTQTNLLRDISHLHSHYQKDKQEHTSEYESMKVNIKQMQSFKAEKMF